MRLINLFIIFLINLLPHTLNTNTIIMHMFTNLIRHTATRDEAIMLKNLPIMLFHNAPEYVRLCF